MLVLRDECSGWEGNYPIVVCSCLSLCVCVYHVDIKGRMYWIEAKLFCCSVCVFVMSLSKQQGDEWLFSLFDTKYVFF